MTSKDVAPEVLEEVRHLLGVIVPDACTEQVRGAAVRLAAIVRREALEDRNLMTIVCSDEPELAPALAHLCRRR